MTPPQKPVVSLHLTPHQPVIPAGLPRWCLLTWQASVMWWVYNECMNFINNIVHRILPHCQQKGWANGFSPKCLFCGALDLRLMLPSEVSHSSGKLTPWNQSLCVLYSPMMQWHTMGAPLVVSEPNPFCAGTVGLTSCGAFGPTTLLLPTSTRTALFSHLDCHTVYTTAINSWREGILGCTVNMWLYYGYKICKYIYREWKYNGPLQGIYQGNAWWAYSAAFQPASACSDICQGTTMKNLK